uniref:TIL domain-containing protein n=1 Tax=Panagrellus redivivus TaxID=6233 RepID=A0A7E4ZWX0_PANRE
MEGIRSATSNHRSSMAAVLEPARQSSSLFAQVCHTEMILFPHFFFDPLLLVSQRIAMTTALSLKASLIALIILTSTVIAGAGPSTKTWKKCELDSDCAPGQLCRLICNRTCTPKCITLLPDKIDPLLKVVTTSESPFFDDGANPFAAVLRDSVVTPLTISEAELEAELAESGDEIPPTEQLPVTKVSVAVTTITEPTPPEGTSSATFPTLISTATEAGDIFPPSTEPQPPGFGYDDHESGYTTIPETTENAISTESTHGSEFTDGITVVAELFSSTEAPIGSDIAEDYQKSSVGVDPNEFSTQELTTPLTITTTIEPFPETDPFSPVDLFPTFTTPGASSELNDTETSTTLTPPEASTFIATDANSDFSSESGENHIDESLPTSSTTVIPGIPPAPPLDGCPAPEVCGKNCGVYIDEDGCQSCQCLWLPILCEENSDCIEEGQFCDLGRCECMPGFIQDMLQSGICKRATDEDLQSVSAVGVKSNTPLIDAKRKENPTASGYRRVRREQSAEKPSRAERLQWPGAN